MEYTALYRRFRPKTFNEILGQDHITQTLKNQFIANRVGHAYLFTGCRGCGKTSAAKVLSRAINCLNPHDGEPCNECSICKSALDGSLTDIVEMDAASNNSVDDVRAIRDEVNFLPTIAKYRVYIIDEVHMLTKEAFNALLKTLEEPPSHVKFILATTEPQKLPATILSRCQRFDFKRIEDTKIVENLEKICKDCNIKHTKGALCLIAELSEGAMRDALSILERCAQDGENNINEEKIKMLVGIPETTHIINIVNSIIDSNEEEILKQTEIIINEGKDINNIIWETIKIVRDLMLLKTTGKISNTYNKKEIEKMNEIASKTNKKRLLKIIYELSELENEIKWSSQKNIVFQVGILKLCDDDTINIEDRISKIEKYIKTGNPKEDTTIRTKQPQNVENENKIKNTSVKPQNHQTKNKLESTIKQSSKSENFWQDIITNLKESGRHSLYANLVNSKGKIIDDMTFGIEFPNGLTPFGKSVIEKPENIEEIRRLVSIQCKSDMKIKLINEKVKKEKEPNNIDIGININIIE